MTRASAAARRRLELRRDQQRQELDDAVAMLHDLRTSRSGAADDDEHDPEGEPLSALWSQARAQEQRAREALAETERALERAAGGSYGICASCGGPIGAERLVALPATELCIACARREAAARNRR